MMAWVLLFVGCIRLEIADCRDNGYRAGQSACEDREDYGEVRDQISTKGCRAAWDSGFAEGFHDCDDSG